MKEDKFLEELAKTREMLQNLNKPLESLAEGIRSLEYRVFLQEIKINAVIKYLISEMGIDADKLNEIYQKEQEEAKAMIQEQVIKEAQERKKQEEAEAE